MTDAPRCEDCDLPRADRVLTAAERAAVPGGGRTDLCWGGCEAIDWRAEALRLRADLAAATARAERIERETVERCCAWLRDEADKSDRSLVGFEVRDSIGAALVEETRDGIALLRNAAREMASALTPAPVDAAARGNRGGDGGGR